MRLKLLTISFTALTLFIFVKSYAQATIVQKVSPTGALPGLYSYTELVTLNNELYFSSDVNPVLGVELSKVSNSSGLMFLFKDLNIGASHSFPRYFFVSPASNELFFGATSNGSNVNEKELWRTDGTTNGTFEVRNINNSETVGSNPTLITEFDDKLIMSAVDAVSSVRYPAIYDKLNDVMLFLNSNQDELRSPEGFYSSNDKVYFSSMDAVTKRELYISDGTSNGTKLLKEINTENSSTDGNSNPKNFIEFNNKVYFSADNVTSGNELWVTDGTAGGTNLVSDINTGSNSSNPENFTVFGDRLYFSAKSDSQGVELYYMKTDESVQLYKDINAGPGSSNPKNLFEFQGHLYFSAHNGSIGREVWRTDGTTLGVNLFKDININQGAFGDNFLLPIIYNNKLYFVANDGVNGHELWVTDGTSSGTNMVVDINASGSGNPLSLKIANNKLYFVGFNGTATNLWVYIDPVLSIDEESDDSSLKTYPNPIKDKFVFDIKKSNSKIEVFDIRGRLVKAFNKTQESYNIAELKSGVYILIVKSNNETQTIKIIKN